MRIASKSVACPICGATGTVTHFEDQDPVRRTEGHRIEFRCSAKRHTLSEVELLRLWAAARLSPHESKTSTPGF